MDPSRVRQARLAAGLSLAQVAGDDVSRTFIHLIEQGRSRPSKAVLALIARRTGKPLAYFTARSSPKSQPRQDLAAQLMEAAAGVRIFVESNRLSGLERETMKLVEAFLHQGAALTKTVQSKHPH